VQCAVSQPGDDAFDHIAETRARLVRYGEHFLVRHVLDETRDTRRHVGDGRDREDAHSHVTRDKHFRNGAHADSVRADWEQLDLPRKPEIFPPKRAVEPDDLPYTLRTPGRHHTRHHYTRIWNFDASDAENDFIGIEHLSQEEVESFRERCEAAAKRAVTKAVEDRVGAVPD